MRFHLANPESFNLSKGGAVVIRASPVSFSFSTLIAYIGSVARGRSPLHLAAVLTLAFSFFGSSLQADPASTLQTLMIVDQGNFISLQWSFYFVDFPPRFVLKENPSETVVLDDPARIEENLSKIVAVAFQIKIDGQSVHPDKISRLDISPNKVCTVTMIYRGQPGAHFELRAPVLKYLPPTTLINYEILSVGHTTHVVTGNLMAYPGPLPQTIDYRQVKVGTSTMPETQSDFGIYFKIGWRTAWINTNWIFISLVLFLILRPIKAIMSLLIMVAGFCILCRLDERNVQLPWSIPEIMLGVPTAFLGMLAARLPTRDLALTLLACGTGCLNAIHDLQPLRLGAEDQPTSALTGLVLGFACSISSLAIVMFIIVGECKKYSRFETEWVPKICWTVATLALVLSLQKTFVQ